MLPVGVPVEGSVARVLLPRAGYRWSGSLEARLEGGGRIVLLMTGSVARWISEGERLRILLESEPQYVDGTPVALPGEYRAWRLWEGEWVEVWPPWRREARLPRGDPVRGAEVYEYRVLAREAESERDYVEIVGLEQYHYASKEEVVAVWRCPVCGRFFESNAQPACPDDGAEARLQEIRGSLPSSRFLVLELLGRREYEPRIVAYVRVDTPIPLMNRRLRNGRIERMIRERVFGEDWFHPTYWPLASRERRMVLARYRELARLYGSRKMARAIVGEEISSEALRRANTAAARIARVVVHPDYRGDGLGVLSVRMAVEWVRERRIPEMKRRKHVVETIAQMARYNPFFEKAGFIYLWDTASGRPVLFYPLTEEARRKIERFLAEDAEARDHGGRLYRPRYGGVDPMPAPIIFKGVSKLYRSELDIARLPQELQEVLRAFGVERRLVERYVLRDVNLEIEPGKVYVVVGASGAGKTTFLRMLIGAVVGLGDERYKPSSGRIGAPEGARVEYLLPGEREPEFGEETLLEHVSSKVGDPATAVEILNSVGLSDAVFYRARFSELSTGQKERAKLASMLAAKPSMMVIDEFAAHLDALTAQRVARRIGRISREAGITLIVSTNRPEIVRALGPDYIVYVGYGTAFIERYEGSDYWKH